jgi:hypothetical protein
VLDRTLSARPTAVFLGDAADVGLARVHARLAATHDVAFWPFGSAELDTHVDVSPQRFVLRHGNRILSRQALQEARLVVFRRRLLRSEPYVVSALAEPADRAFSEREWGALVEALLLDTSRESSATWMNRPDVEILATRKLALLLAAARLGLTVPAFRITTDGDDLDGAGARLAVTKAIAADERIDAERHLTTTTITPEVGAEFRGIKLTTPALVQDRVEAVHELRVYYVLGAILVLRLRPRPSSSVDIRFLSREEMDVQAGTLPRPTELGLRALVRRLDLEFCAFDLLVDADAVHHLVDVTPNGSWDYFESPDDPRVSHAIAAIMADHLDRKG